MKHFLNDLLEIIAFGNAVLAAVGLVGMTLGLAWFFWPTNIFVAWVCWSVRHMKSK